MKAHLITVLVIDFENAGSTACAELVATSRYVHATTLTTDTADIGEWTDDHRLNRRDLPTEEALAYFKDQTS